MAGKYSIYHNPRCSKSRQVLQTLRDAGIEPEVIEYLKSPPTVTQLKALLRALAIPAHGLLRTKESAYKEASLSKGSSERDVLNAIATNPILLERPIVVAGKRAVIARPAERVNEVI